MRILIVCGAGASSTFVALRVRKTAAARGLEVSVAAGSDADLSSALGGIDVLLVGPHLEDRLAGIRAQMDAHGVALGLLPATIFQERDGAVALDLALEAAGTAQNNVRPFRGPAESGTTSSSERHTND